MLLVGNGRTVTRDAQNPYFEDGCVAIEGQEIVDVGPTQQLKAKHTNYRFIDARGGLIMPGFINAHMHYYSAFSRGFPGKGEPARSFDEVLERLWWRLDKALTLDDSYYSAMVCMIDCIKNGCTTVIDHHASPCAVRGSLFRIADAARETGIRSCLSYEVSDRDGERIMREGIEENMEFIKYAAEDRTGLLAGTFGLHASMTLSDATLAACREAMGDLGAGYHVHVAEGYGDEIDSEKKYGKRILERFRDFGITGPRSIAVHCIHIDDDEKEILKDTGTAVVHNPESNMGNAVGCSAVLDMAERGILLGLGTDGFVSDMLQSLKMANALQKHHNQHPSVGFAEVTGMLFKGNADIARRYFAAPLGRLAPGCSADVVISDYLPPTRLDGTNADGHLLFGASSRSVTTTIARGRVLMENRRLLDIDEDEVLAKARVHAEKVWERI